jgi:hypothetical protein
MAELARRLVERRSMQAEGIGLRPTVLGEEPGTAAAKTRREAFDEAAKVDGHIDLLDRRKLTALP